MTRQILKHRGLFTSDSALSTWMERSGEWKVVGLIKGSGGRPNELLMLSPPAATFPPANAWHELKLTEAQYAIEDGFPGATTERWSRSEANEDLSAVFAGQKWLLEMEAGSEAKKQFCTKFPGLVKSSLPVACLVSVNGGDSERRMDQILNWVAEEGGDLAARFFAANLDAFLAAPGGDVWVRPGGDEYHWIWGADSVAVSAEIPPG